MDEKKTTDALVILHRRHYAGKPERLEKLEQARVEDKELIEKPSAQQPKPDPQSATIFWVGDLEAGSREIREQISASLELSARELCAGRTEPYLDVFVRNQRKSDS